MGMSPQEKERFRAALAIKESAGNPSAIQWDTKARGLYQFIPRWHKDWIEKETGRSLDSFLPKDGSAAEMERSVREQNEILFPRYFERELQPFINDMRKSKLGGEYTDADLAAMAHFAGRGGARKYLRTGVDDTLGTAGNAAGGIKTYVEQFRAQYAGAPQEKFSKLAASARHYGEYGLGRGVYAFYKDKDLGDKDLTGRKAAQRALYRGEASPAVVLRSPPGTTVTEESVTVVEDTSKKKDQPLPPPSEPQLPPSSATEPSPDPQMPQCLKTSPSLPSGQRLLRDLVALLTKLRIWKN